MEVRTPTERAFIYECTGRADRLFCWIPPGELGGLGKRNACLESDDAATSSLEEDHPYGLEFRVAPREIGFLERDYGLKLDFNPQFVIAAFKALREQSPKKFRGIGLIGYSFLIDLAKRIEEGAPNEVRQYIEDPESLTTKHRSQRARTVRQAHLSKTRRFLKRIERLPELHDNPGRVAMSKGDPAADLFVRVQRSRKGD